MGLFSYFLNKNQATELEDTIVACWNKIQNYKKSNIEGDITLEEAQKLIHIYYNKKSDRTVETEEADKVSVRIATLLSEKSFVFYPIQYLSIHKKLFEGIYNHAGKIRDYNITKTARNSGRFHILRN